MAGWTVGLEAWLSTAEIDAETIELDGVTHRYKLDSEKQFLTPGGMIRLARRVYQADAGGPCYVPLDAAWDMENQFATVEVRDAALYAVALDMPQDRAPTLKAKFEQELQETESRLSHDVVRIVLCDGARGLWSYIDDNPLYDDYEKLLDYHHAVEHLSKAAEAIFGNGSPQAQNWYDQHCAKLKGEDGAAKRMLRCLNYQQRTAKLSKSRREALDKEQTFFARNAHRMDYARFRGNGWPIGSGPVEAACKSIVKTRLCRSGMRWSRDGGQHILSLRTYVKSNRWNALWKQYKQIEQPRFPGNTT